MVHEQCQPNTRLEDAETIARNILHARHQRSHMFDNSLTFDDFVHFLFSFELNPPIPLVHQDMRYPLSHYFIFTGHNSYLTGNQLTSPSSNVPIIEALKKGVRVIELDIWPNSAKTEVLVLHGRTLTSPVKLVTCLKSIAKYTFVTSPLPVIITFEDHLEAPLQARVAQLLKQTLANFLYIPKCDSESLREFGSPESLQHKILISTKPPKEYLEPAEAASLRERDVDEDVCGPEPRHPFLPPGNYEYIEDGEDDLGPQREHSYKSLIAFHSKKPREGIVEALRVDSPYVRRLSLAKLKVQGAA